MKEQFNASVPSEDRERFAKSIADFAEKMTTYAGSAADPAGLPAEREVLPQCFRRRDRASHRKPIRIEGSDTSRPTAA